MGFAKEARKTDADQARDITLDLLNSPEVPAEADFFVTEMDRADEIPLLRGMAEGVAEVRRQLALVGHSRERMEGIITGFTMARIVVRAVISIEEEIPDYMPVEGL